MAAQRSSVQSSPAHFSQCSPGVNRAGQDFHSHPSLRFTCSASLSVLLFSVLLCCCSCSFVIYVASLAFSWLPSMLVYCCWRCLWQGRICCYCCCYCYLPIDCTLQCTAHSGQSALVMRGQFEGSTYQEVSQFHCRVPSIVQLYFGFIWLYLAFAFTFTFACLSLRNLLSSC